MKAALITGARTFVAFGLAVAGVTAAQPPASAAFSDCNYGYLCVWTGQNGTGVMATFTVGDADLANPPGPSGMNNNIESAWSRGAGNWCFYDYASYSTLVRKVYSTTGGIDFDSIHDNRTTSIRPCDN